MQSHPKMYFSRHSLLSFSLLMRASHASLYGESSLNHTCALRMIPLDFPSWNRCKSNYLSLETPYLSCSAQAYPNITDSCCTETFGGLVLSTQYWDTYTGYEAKGQVLPRDTWTLHGLWPDFCNGSYTQYCDLKFVFISLYFAYGPIDEELLMTTQKSSIRPRPLAKYNHRNLIRDTCTSLHRS